MHERPSLRATLLFASDDADEVAEQIVLSAAAPTGSPVVLLQSRPIDMTGVDALAAAPEVVERHTGCASCALRWDLVRELSVVAKRKQQPGHVIVRGGPWEDPATAAQTLLGDLELAGRIDINAILTVIDAPALATRMRSGDAWHGTGHTLAQVRMADTILVMGLDWLTESAQWEVGAELARWNPRAALVHQAQRVKDLRELLVQDAWSLPVPAEALKVGRPDGVMGCRSLEVAGAVDEDLLAGWVDHLHDHLGAGLLRWSGTFALAGSGRELHAHGVRSTVQAGNAATAGAVAAASRVVIVADDLDDALEPLVATLDGCRA